MQLTGILYQDYTNLTSFYKDTGKILLTGNKDVDYQILAKLDLQDLSKVCRSNKYTRQLCDEEFWIYKYQQENLDVLYKPSSFEEWLKWYDKAKQASLDALYTLTIYDIQYKNIFPPIRIINQSNDMFLNALLKQADDKVNYYFKKPNITHIIITPNKSTYNIELNFKYFNSINDAFTKDKLIKLFSYVYRYSWPNVGDLVVLCDSHPLVVTELYANTHANIGNNRILYKREGILQSIMYYEA